MLPSPPLPPPPQKKEGKKTEIKNKTQVNDDLLIQH